MRIADPYLASVDENPFADAECFVLVTLTSGPLDEQQDRAEYSFGKEGAHGGYQRGPRRK